MRLQTRLCRPATSLAEIIVVMAIIMILSGLSFYAFSAAKGFADKMEADTRMAIGHVSRHGKNDPKAGHAITLATNPTVRPLYVAGQYYVGFNRTVTDPKAEAQRLANLVGGSVVGVYTHATYGCGLRCPDANIGNLTGDAAVSMVQQARAAYLCSSAPLNIQRVNSNGIINTATQKMFGAPPSVFRMYRNTNVQGIVNSRVYLNGATTASIAVAVLDSGIDKTHPDLHVVYEQDCTGGNDPSDTFGHGTHVAGVIGAVDKTASGGVVGVYPGAPLLNLKVRDATNTVSSLYIYTALDYVAANAGSIPICCCPLHSKGDPVMDAMVNQIAGLGVIVVASIGDPPASGVAVNADIAPGISPAGAAGAIAVGNLFDLDGLPGGFKADDTYLGNYGSAVAFVAPGGSGPGGYLITSTIPLAGQAANQLSAPYSDFLLGNTKGTFAAGTSFSAAHVAGMMAVLKDPQTNLGFVLGVGRGVTTYHLQMNTRDQAVAALFNATHQTTPFQMIDPLTGSAWQVTGFPRRVTPYTKALFGDYCGPDPLGRSIPVANFYANPGVGPSFLAPFPG